MKRRTLLFITALLTTAAGASAHEGVSAEIAALDRKIAAHPRDASLLVQRASLLRRERHYRGALADLARAELAAPGSRDVLLERGLTLFASGDRRGAESALDRFLSSGAPHFAALSARGKLHEARGQHEAAHRDYDEATRLRADPDLFLSRGRAAEAAGDLDRAARDYEEALTLLSGAVTVRLSLVQVESRRGRFERAEALLDEAMSQAPIKADLRLLRAGVREKAGRAEGAREDREAALREIEEAMVKRPNDLLRLSRARALMALGRPAEAVPVLEKVVASSPRLPEGKALLTEARSRARSPRR